MIDLIKIIYEKLALFGTNLLAKIAGIADDVTNLETDIESITQSTNTQGVSDPDNTASGLIWCYQSKAVTSILVEIGFKPAPTEYVDKGNERWFPIGTIPNKNVFNLPAETLADFTHSRILGVSPWQWNVLSDSSQACFAMSCYAFFDGTDTVLCSHVSKTYFDTFRLTNCGFQFAVPT